MDHGGASTGASAGASAGASDRGQGVRVLLALDSFGGTMTAPEACERAAARLSDHGILAHTHPLSDGGEGLIACLASHRRLRLDSVATTDALGRPRRAVVAFEGDDAIIESAESIGLRLLLERRPLDASSAGIGPLLVAARGASRIIVGLGGSATVDGGLGMLRALGLSALDRAGRVVEGPPARILPRVDRLVGPPPALPVGVSLADVATPFTASGTRFGPQKGLSPLEVKGLGLALRSFAAVLCRYASETGVHLHPDLPGGGAAGGLGLALAAIGLPPIRGAEAVAQHTGLDAAVARADVVVIGEGRLDATSWEGKVAGAAHARARRAGAAVVGLVGGVRDDADQRLDHVVCTGQPDTASFLSAVDRLAQWIATRPAR